MKNAILLATSSLAVVGLVGTVWFLREAAPATPASEPRARREVVERAALTEATLDAPVRASLAPAALAEPGETAVFTLDETTTRVCGRVLHWQTRQPVPGLSVGPSVRGDPDRPVGLATSLQEGRFELAPCAPDTALEAWGATGDETWCTVRCGLAGRVDEHGEVTILVAPSATCTARVAEPHGSALEGARVALEIDASTWTPEPALWSRTQRVELSARTDERGVCELGRVPRMPGIRVRAALAGYEDASAALPADPIAPSRMRVDLVLTPLSAVVVVDGRVLHVDGAPAAFAEVRWGRAKAQSDALGRFSIRALPGDEADALTAQLVGFVASAPQEPPVAPGEALDLRLGPASAAIAGSVRGTHGNGLQRASVLLFPDPETQGHPLASANVDRNGAFRFEGLVPGPYALWLVVEGRPPVTQRIQAMTGNENLILETPAPSEVAVAGARVAGLVLDGEGRAAEGVRIQFGPQTRLRRPLALTGSDGRFERDGVCGPWTLIEVDDGSAVGSYVRVLGPLDLRDTLQLRNATK